MFRSARSRGPVSPCGVVDTEQQGKLHAKSSCGYLRSARVTEREVRLDATTVGRLCGQCAGLAPRRGPRGGTAPTAA